MATASRSLATALWGARFASGLLRLSYTTPRGHDPTSASAIDPTGEGCTPSDWLPATAANGSSGRRFRPVVGPIFERQERVDMARSPSHRWNGRCCAGFWTPASRVAPLAPAAGVQKAPGHEVAGRGGRAAASGYGDLIFRRLW